MRPDISIIIISYNTLTRTRNCLLSLYKDISDIDQEVFVVDNNSIDGSPSMILKEFPFVKLISNKTNKGFAQANNQAMKIAEGRYILLINSDTIILPRSNKKGYNLCR